MQNGSRRLKNILEKAFFFIATLFFVVVGICVPSLAIISFILAAIPVATTVVKWARKRLIVAFAVLCVVALMFAKPLFAVQYLIGLLVPGIVTGILIKREERFPWLVTGTTLSFIAAFLLIAWLNALAIGKSIMEIHVVENIRYGLRLILDLFLSYMPFRFESGYTDRFLGILTEQYSYYIPSLMLVVSLITGIAVLVVVKKILKSMGVDAVEILHPAGFFMPRGAFWALLVSFILVMFGGMNYVMTVTLINIMVIILFGYAVQGLSFMEYYMSKNEVAAFMKAGAYITIILVFFLTFVLSMFLPFFNILSPLNMLIILGIADNSFMIRKNGEKGNYNG